MSRTDVPELRSITTACPLDCPDACTLDVTVSGEGPAQRIERVDAAPVGESNLLTDGWICAKVRRSAERVYSPERVLTPLVRTGPKGSGRFEPISWDEALDRTASAIRAAVRDHGPASVVPFLYNSSAPTFSDRLSTRLFLELGTSAVAHTICAATAAIAWHATFPNMASADPLDVAHSDLVVLWGANPSASNTHLTPLLTDARARGAAVVVVDPRRTPTAARADLHLAVRPGTDVALALAVAHELERLDLVDRAFCAQHADGVEEHLDAAREWTPERAAEVCGVDAAQVTALAELVGGRRPGMLRVGWGMERNRNGGSSIRAALATWVLAGQFGRPGAGVIQSTSSSADDDTLPDLPGAPAHARVLNMNRIGRDLLDADPPVRVLFVQGANPAVMAPDQRSVLAGLGRDDLFTVVHEQVMTDTAALADIVLPATTSFESGRDVAVGYGAYAASPIRQVIPRVGESRTNAEVAEGLAQRLGLSGYGVDDVPPPPVPDRAVSTRPDGTVQFGPAGAPGTTLPDGGRARLVLGPGSDRLPVFRELDGGEHPLTLLSPATTRTINSIFAEFDPPRAAVTMHPDDAGARGVATGDEVRVFNERAELRLPAVVDAAVRPGVVVIPKGLWRRHVGGGLTANALVPDDVEATVGGAVFNDTTVEVARA
ncbi:molybdopterin-containing oxidoreductase family protein [Dermatobacter hominis]|uniref:molybdopterin-containing oxidoreductase family protein n=1 Tax=Dermatobacter hominis TaxID=2884263 RepID=UPI001D101A8A|nr:molybdopterin-dependent oxidoreductase [Dermatobacter hominis]UDY34725.1 molybdopterin-dependent oxidoreductase [Dermatobacter hominis]